MVIYCYWCCIFVLLNFQTCCKLLLLFLLATVTDCCCCWFWFFFLMLILCFFFFSNQLSILSQLNRKTYCSNYPIISGTSSPVPHISSILNGDQDVSMLWWASIGLISWRNFYTRSFYRVTSLII